MNIFLFFREAYTLQLLKKFKAKLSNIKSTNDDEPDESTSKDDADDEELNSDKWMVGEIVFDKCHDINSDKLDVSTLLTVSYTAVQ